MPPLESNDVNLEKLKRYYQANPEARLLLDYFAMRQRGHTSEVDRLEKVKLQGDVKLPRGVIVDILKQLDALGYGNFILGRRSHPSRFHWQVSMASVGKAAAGEGQIEELVPAQEDEDDIDSLQHAFRLRPNYMVTLSLPLDLDAYEATRLADFIKTLPFGASRDVA